MNIGYFPGCSLTGTSKEYDISLRAVLKTLGVELNEINDWSCCGASSAHVTNHLLALALPARNLLLAHKQGLEEVMAPCAACYNRLVSTQHEIGKSEQLREKIERVLEEPYSDGAQIINIIQLFERIGAGAIHANVKVDLSHLKVACYYGCLLVGPAGLLHFDDAEQPVSMEKLIEAAGAKTVDWNFKTECCGAAHSIAHTDIVMDLSKKILLDAQRSGADAVIVACPMCHSNLDMRQKNIKKQDGAFRNIPVLYLSELIGIALGMDEKQLGLNLHFIDVAPALAKAGKKGAVA
jgi:heterodisulfide reductase subunit B2